MLVNRTVRFLLFGLAEQTGKPTKCQNVNHIRLSVPISTIKKMSAIICVCYCFMSRHMLLEIVVLLNNSEVVL